MPTQSVHRAISILKQFTIDEPQLGVSELSRRLGLTKSTVYRLLATLREAGLVEQEPISRKYHLGVGLLELANVVMETHWLVQPVHAYLRYLAASLKQATYIGVLDGPEMLTLLREATSDLTEELRSPTRMPLHCTSSGKVLLAHAPEAELEAYLQRGLSRQTENTITDPAELRQELERVREQGFGTCFEEYKEGANAIAVPIVTVEGTVIATLGVVGHSYSLTREKAMNSLERMRGIAKKISLELGSLPPAARWPFANYPVRNNPSRPSMEVTAATFTFG